MSVEYLGTKNLQISETKKVEVNFLKLIPENKQQETTNHHILLADVSGSMSSNIRTLKERIIATFDALLKIPNSYVSVITYSGHNQSKTILSAIKCDQTSYAMSKVYDVIEKELYIKGVTVMSEPLEDAIKICKSLAGVCDKHQIALFTDGCLVPWDWSEQTEREKCFKVAEICRNENIYLNAIGFGQYYDRRFLKELTEKAGNGCVIHIDSVKDYSEVILSIIKKVNEENLETHTIECNGNIFNIANSTFNLSPYKSVVKNNCVAIFDDNWKAPAIKEPSLYVVDDFYYSLARYYLNNDDLDNYEFIVKLLGDVNLYESTQNCYSFIEKGNAVNKVTETLEDVNKRFVKGRQPIVETLEGEKLCILEILQMIMEDKDSNLIWDLNTPYHRITQKTNTIEDAIKFERQSEGFVPVTSLTVGSTKLNIGVKVRQPGKVIDTISGLSMDSCIFRDYNIVNGGNINVPYINATLSMKLFTKFVDEGLLQLQVLPKNFNGKGVYTIDLTGIKSTNKRILKSMSMNEIIKNLVDIAELKCKQWALNQIKNEVVGDKSRVDLIGLSIEEQELRKLLRIDENGIYQPLETEKDDTSPFEIYPAVHMTWGINKFPEKAKKEEYLKDIKKFLNDCNYIIGKNDEEIFDLLNTMLEVTRNEMHQKEHKVNSIRIASAMMNKSPFTWDEEIEKAKTANDKILGRNMIVGGITNQCKKDTNDVIVQQNKWVQLIKCN